LNPWKKLICSWLQSFCLAALSSLAGLIIGEHYIALAKIAVRDTRIAWFQGIGVTVVLLATLAFVSWGIQTRGGTSMPEKVNNWVLRVLYVVGSSLLIASVVHSK
jgi:hypothetical protein